MHLTRDQLATERHTLLAGYRVSTPEQCLQFIEDMGFCYAFTPGDGDLPALFSVLDTQSEEQRWNWVWPWKDQLPLARRCYYGRVIAEKPSFVSNRLIAQFYALTGNVNEPDDHREAFKEGRLSPLSVRLYEFIEQRGPVDSLALRRHFDPEGKGKSHLDRALAQLSEQFLITRAGVVNEGRHRYLYIWDLFSRFLPDVAAEGAAIPGRVAAAAILEQYLRLVVAQHPETVRRLFGWSERLYGDTVARMESEGRLTRVHVDGLGEALALART